MRASLHQSEGKQLVRDRWQLQAVSGLAGRWWAAVAQSTRALQKRGKGATGLTELAAVEGVLLGGEDPISAEHCCLSMRSYSKATAARQAG